MSQKQTENEKIQRAAAKAMNKRAKKGIKYPLYHEWRYYIWGGGMGALMLAGMLLMIIHPDRSPNEIPVNDDQNIGLINRNSKTWKAKPVEFFEDWTIGDVKTLEGVMVGSMGGSADCPMTDVAIPKEYDLREKFPNCFNYPVYEIKNCSSSWAIATSTALGNRICMSDPTAHENLLLSPQQLLSCDQANRGCQGGDIDSVWGYIERQGLVAETCMPYQGDSGLSCETKCKEPGFRAASHCALKSEEAIKKEILTHGPVVAPMFVNDDLLVYRDGVYKPMPTAVSLTDRQRQRLIQAVKLVGWGEAFGLPYWIVENSWGSDWGQDGYGLVLRGNLNGKVENVVFDKYAVAGTPGGKTDSKDGGSEEEDFGEDIDIDEDDDAITDVDLDDDEV